MDFRFTRIIKRNWPKRLWSDSIKQIQILNKKNCENRWAYIEHIKRFRLKPVCMRNTNKKEWVALTATVKGLTQVNLECLLILIDCDWNKILNCTEFSWDQKWPTRLVLDVLPLHSTFLHGTIYTHQRAWTFFRRDANGSDIACNMALILAL